MRSPKPLLQKRSEVKKLERKAQAYERLKLRLKRQKLEKQEKSLVREFSSIIMKAVKEIFREG